MVVGGCGLYVGEGGGFAWCMFGNCLFGLGIVGAGWGVALALCVLSVGRCVCVVGVGRVVSLLHARLLVRVSVRIGKLGYVMKAAYA